MLDDVVQTILPLTAAGNCEETTIITLSNFGGDGGDGLLLVLMCLLLFLKHRYQYFLIFKVILKILTTAFLV